MAQSEIGHDARSMSVVIAAYNEERFIAQTIESVLRTGAAQEVIVVDDGSSDRTAEILSEHSGRISVIVHAANRGKGAALATGIRRATSDIVVFCDAHLLGLERRHLLALTQPIEAGHADVTLGVATRKVGSDAIGRLTPTAILTGQRAYRRECLLPWLAEMEHLGYGVETFLHTKHASDTTLVVRLPGLVHLTKRHTTPPATAVARYVQEAREVSRAAMRLPALRQMTTARTVRQVVVLARRLGLSE